MTTAELLKKDIEVKEQRYRIARAVFIGLLLLVPVLGGAIGYSTLINSQQILKHVEEQQNQLTTAVDELKTNTNTGLQKANDHLDCIAIFFSTPDRINKTLDGCEVNPAASPVAPQASSEVDSKAVTVTPAAATPSQASQENPQPTPTPAPKPTPIQNALQAVQKVINNLARSL